MTSDLTHNWSLTSGRVGVLDLTEERFEGQDLTLERIVDQHSTLEQLDHLKSLIPECAGDGASGK